MHSGWALDDKDGSAVTCDHYNQYGNPYFGDLHAHTTFSVDAFTQGVDTTPEQAYEFAKGQQIGLHPFDVDGVPLRYAQIDRPLDFAMVSDHAEFFGEFTMCTDPENPAYADPTCELLRQRTAQALVQWNFALAAAPDKVKRFDFCGSGGSLCTQAAATIWQRMQDAAEQYYDRSPDCEFTTFVGYEWTGAPLGFNELNQAEVRNLHRNILFSNSIVPSLPVTYLDAAYPGKLWDSLQKNCRNNVNGSNRCEVITIPHNSNLSQGLMFEAVNANGTPYNGGNALVRRSFEPLIEVTQHKGQSECLPTNNDELCNFEVLRWGHLGGNFITPTEPKVEGTVRDALKAGLLLKDTINSNPSKYGLIGSTDTHLGTPGLVEESVSYPGHGGAAGGIDGESVRPGITDAAELNPGGLAVIWAKQNSRAALFDAMVRREAYATSGPRHVVRFFGGWDMPTDMCTRSDRIEAAYANAVPMGSTLPASANPEAVPQFLVTALKDAGPPGRPGNDLQRIQIIKGWTDSAGVKHEQIYEVAGDPANGASVDVNSCETSGTGFAELCQQWQDPDFNPTQNAFYYARVVENPSCRWTQKQCIAAADPIDCSDPASVPAEYTACCDAEVPKTVQERSWTSPIWYEEPGSTGC